MGLFGGFKANFVSKLRKRNKDDGVVCLKYIVCSEFDDHLNSPPVETRTVKPNRPIIKSTYYEENRQVKENLPKSQSLSGLDTATSNNQLGNSRNSRSENEYEEPIDNNIPNVSRPTTLPLSENNIRNTSLTNSVQTVTNSLYLAGSDYSTKSEQNMMNYNSNNSINEDYEEISPVEEYKKFLGDTDNGNKSALIFMTQASLDDREKNVENGEDNFEVNIQTVKIVDDEEDSNPNVNFKIKEQDDEFHVHFVDNEINRPYSLSEDELSDPEADFSEYKSMGYSSQAASIFFGEEEPPKLPRPRRIILSENTDSLDEDDC